MTTDAQATLLHAAEVLEANASIMCEVYFVDPSNPDWKGRIDVRNAHCDLVQTALELRLLARSIKIDHIPDVGKMVSTVSPAPTFKEKPNDYG